MNYIDVWVVRIYVMESSHVLDKMLKYLKDAIKIRGLSVFRAISGYGTSGEHSAAFLDLSLDLPLALEFFDDDKNKVEEALNHLQEWLEPEHIIIWEAKSIV